MVLSIIRAFAAADGSAAQTSWTQYAIVLLGTIVLLLGVFFAGVVLLTRSQQRRVRDRDVPPPTVLPDAWSEAGRRMQTPDAGRDDDSEDTLA